MADPLYIYLHSPETVFAARINMPGTIDYPVTSLTFDNVTTGAYTDIEEDMTLLLGTSAGADDLGRVRVQGTATSTTISIPRTSQGTYDGELDIVDDAYITVLMDFRVWAKIPYIEDDGTMYKDSNVALGDFGTEPPPVANCGPGFAATIDPDTEVITVSFAAGNSFAVADGATISTYAWDVGDGTITTGTASDANITATFPAGFRYVALTVTDSNDHSHTARCPVFARDPDDDDTLQHVVIERHHVEQSGQELDLRIFDDLPRATYPDGMLCMFWRGEPISPSDRTHMEFVGWHQVDDLEVRATRTGNIEGSVLHFVDVAGRLKTFPGFDQEITSADTPATWAEMLNPTLDKYIHYLLQWHSTALSVADYIPSGTGDQYPFYTFNSEGETFYDQVRNKANGFVPTHQFECNRQGQLKVVKDEMLIDASERSLTTSGSQTEAFVEQIRFSHTRPPRVHTLNRQALLAVTETTLINGVETSPVLYARAPGTAPGQGINEVHRTIGLARSQAALNSVAGHEYARLNSPYGLVTVVAADDDAYEDVQATCGTWFGLYLSAENAAARGFTFNPVRTQVKALDFRYQQTRSGVVRRTEFTLEIETVGRPALTVIPEGSTYNPIVTTPPTFGLVDGQESVALFTADGHIFTTSDFQTESGDGGPTWTDTDLELDEDTVYSFVVDPFSPGYLEGTGAINAWIVTGTDLYRVEDIFGTVSVTSVHTFGTALGTSSVPGQEWRTVQASFGYFQPEAANNPWLMVVSYYHDASGHTGTWCLYSTDGGQTFADEVQISDVYNDAIDSEARQIAVYLSPKTPGLAYAAAYAEFDDEGSPLFIFWDGGFGADPEIIGTGNEITMTTYAESSESNPGLKNLVQHMTISPPPTTKRVKVAVDWSAYGYLGGPSASIAGGYDLWNRTDSGYGRTGNDNYVGPSPVQPGEDSTSGSFEVEFTHTGGGGWSPNKDDTYDSDTNHGPAIGHTCVASGFGSQAAILSITSHIRVTEIELEDGTIYAPAPGKAGILYKSTDWGATWAQWLDGDDLPVVSLGDRLGGDIHVPWLADGDSTVYYGSMAAAPTRQFSLSRLNGDGTTDDLTPADNSIDYGPFANHFRLRAHDSNATLLLMSLTGNSTSGDAGDDVQGVFVSTDSGATATLIVGPTSSSEAYAAAWSGDSTDVLYLYGPAGYIATSDDQGDTIDDRSGNLSTTSVGIGIAGGPSGD